MGETAALITAMVVSAAASAGTAIYAGEQQRAAGKAQRQQYEEERRAAALAAEQQEAETRRRLNAVLSAQNALRAARGLDLGSPTGQLLREEAIADAAADIDTLRLDAARLDRRLDLAGDVAAARGEAALIGAIGSGVASVAQAGVSGWRVSRMTSGGGVMGRA